MAFGGSRPTLLDALNVLNFAAGSTGAQGINGGDAVAGDVTASTAGIAALAAEHGLSPESLAQMAADDALAQVAAAASALTDGINARPIYTLAALKAVREARPQHVWLVGGPAACVARRMLPFLFGRSVKDLLAEVGLKPVSGS